MADSNGPATTRENSLQWFREIVTAAISIAILVTAVRMMSGTYEFAKTDPFDKTALPADATARRDAIDLRKDAYERQKDIMLYAIALLGTVTGYYLGRVPAELHAQQAQKSAANAQAQLEKTQTQLTETASTAATQAAVAQTEKSAAEARVHKATSALETARDALAGIEEGRDRVLADATAESVRPVPDNVRRARDEVERVLAELRLPQI